ncbi:MAG: Na+/H+ antiporter subunit E [Pseudomonadota bacterium]|nr:Na+/H+ antiporter subunit E [Pseudomonadota bacterium]MDP1903599.1 Na+/H+ antiporter subunit E [Pseudomonadota bacterium]MDP2351532.1 Na+/H+ antiporter subunit E [Pseudomonadota bacterium]
MMAKARASVLLFATLLGFWLLLNGSLATDVLVIGVIAALVITLLFRDSLAVVSEFRATPHALITAPSYVFYFLKELVRSNLRLASIVLSPALPLRPGIVKVRTRLKSRMGRLLLANSITLTPGTLTVELDGEWLYVHWVTVESEDVDAATADIVNGFERYLEVMYG